MTYSEMSTTQRAQLAKDHEERKKREVITNRQAQADHLARAMAIADEMGQNWTLVVDAEPPSPYMTQARYTIKYNLSGVAGTGILLGFDTKNIGKLEIRGEYPRQDGQYVSLGIHDETPSICVSYNRGAKTIVGEIRRRFMGRYTDRIEQVMKAIDRSNNYRANIERTADRLAAALGVEANSPRGETGNTRSRAGFFRSKDSLNCDIVAHEDSGRIEISASTDVLEAVLKTLRKQIDK